MSQYDWVFWFNMTNFALGMITVLAVVVVISAVGWDLFSLWLHKSAKSPSENLNSVTLTEIKAGLLANWPADSHSLNVPGLGFTMADGGERIEPSEKPAEKQDRK